MAQGIVQGELLIVGLFGGFLKNREFLCQGLPQIVGKTHADENLFLMACLYKGDLSY